jgi:signal transduction histidine kinase
MLVNLLENAIHACGTGGRITVRAAVEHGLKTVTVQDNGKGMRSEELRHITEPFYRAEKSRNRKDGGAGLGLAVCKQIAERHEAKLEFTSQPGAGTTVKVIFTTS